MINSYFWSHYASTSLLLVLLASSARAQAPNLVSISPVANAQAVPRNAGVVASFSQPLIAGSAGALRVFSSQRGGLRSGSTSTTTVTGANLACLPTAYDFRPGETVQYTLTRAVASAGGPLAASRVGQFTTAVGGTGRGAFYPMPDRWLGAQTSVLTLGDLDSDGDSDLLMNNYAAGTIGVRLNNGAGAFSGTFDIPNSTQPYELTMGDIDGDGDLDLVAANMDPSSNAVKVYSNNGGGTFGSSQDVGIGHITNDVALADVDGDGDLDLLAATYTWNIVSVCLNSGTGTFGSPLTVATGAGPGALALGDVDNDGDLDLLTANVYANSVSVRLNDGAGLFSGIQDVPTPPRNEGLALGDVDGDGDLDFVVSSLNATGQVHVALNNGSGVFSVSQSVAVGNNPYTVVLGDVDADGDLDLLTGNVGPGTASVRLNNGSGVFSGTTDVPVGGLPYLTVSDVDGDADLDMVIGTSSLTNTVAVLLNGGTGPLATTLGTAPVVLAAYPNPATGRVQLELPLAASRAELLDALGRTVRVVPATAGAAQLDVTGLSSGLYVVRAAGQVARLVVE